MRIFLNIILIILLSVVQLSFVSVLPGPLASLNLILVIFVFILVLGGLRLGLWWAFGTGLVMDALSFSPFGSYVLSLTLTVAAVDFLIHNFFTNRSLYSFLALTFFFTLIFRLVFYLVGLIAQIFGNDHFSLINFHLWVSLAGEIALNLLAALIIFYLLNFLNKKLSPVFLVKKKF